MLDAISQAMDLDALLTTEIPVKFKAQTYTLCQASEESVIKFRSAQLRDAKMVDGKLQANLSQIADSQSLLVSLCLKDATGNPVAQSILKTWPAPVVKQLFEKAKEISDLEERPKTREDLRTELDKLTKQLDDLEKNGDPKS